jgi:LacI family transcriptional regulator
MDNAGGGRMVVDHLMKLGHSKIGFIGGDLKHPSIAERYGAYRDTLQARGIGINPKWVSVDETGTRFDNGYRAAKNIFADASNRPTAVFAANDALALGCMRFCREIGLSVPGSVAIVGFDNVESGLLVEPRLTTVNVHREEMGGIAVRRLVEMIREKSNIVDRSTTPVELVVRDSCGGKHEAQPEKYVALAIGIS